jgi:hypothetical protein
MYVCGIELAADMCSRGEGSTEAYPNVKTKKSEN